MRIYADAAGTLLRVTADDEQDATYGPPEGYAEVLEVDPDTNPQIVAALTGQLRGVRWQDVRLSGGVLSHKGQPVTVNPPGGAWRAAEERADAQARILAAIDSALGDYEQALSHWDGLTQAQLKAVVKRLVQVQVQLLRYHRREVLDAT